MPSAGRRTAFLLAPLAPPVPGRRDPPLPAGETAPPWPASLEQPAAAPEFRCWRPGLRQGGWLERPRRATGPILRSQPRGRLKHSPWTAHRDVTSPSLVPAPGRWKAPGSWRDPQARLWHSRGRAASPLAAPPAAASGAFPAFPPSVRASPDHRGRDAARPAGGPSPAASRGGSGCAADGEFLRPAAAPAPALRRGPTRPMPAFSGKAAPRAGRARPAGCRTGFRSAPGGAISPRY